MQEALGLKLHGLITHRVDRQLGQIDRFLGQLRIERCFNQAAERVLCGNVLRAELSTDPAKALERDVLDDLLLRLRRLTRLRCSAWRQVQLQTMVTTA